MQLDEVRVMLHVADLANEVTFWTEQLGFDEVRRFDRGVMLAVGSTTVELFHEPDAPQASTRFSLRVADIDDLWTHWRDRDDVGWPLRHNPWGDRSFSRQSPNGIEVIFFQSD